MQLLFLSIHLFSRYRDRGQDLKLTSPSVDNLNLVGHALRLGLSLHLWLRNRPLGNLRLSGHDHLSIARYCNSSSDYVLKTSASSAHIQRYALGCFIGTLREDTVIPWRLRPPFRCSRVSILHTQKYWWPNNLQVGFTRRYSSRDAAWKGGHLLQTAWPFNKQIGQSRPQRE